MALIEPRRRTVVLDDAILEQCRAMTIEEESEVGDEEKSCRDSGAKALALCS